MNNMTENGYSDGRSKSATCPSSKPSSMLREQPEVIVYHSAYGLRPAIIEFADNLRAAGYLVHTPDLYDGEVFSDRNDAVRKNHELRADAMLQEAVAAAGSLTHDLVYTGFSNG